MGVVEALALPDTLALQRAVPLPVCVVEALGVPMEEAVNDALALSLVLVLGEGVAPTSGEAVPGENGVGVLSPGEAVPPLGMEGVADALGHGEGEAGEEGLSVPLGLPVGVEDRVAGKLVATALLDGVR